jgi:type VI protein secretion system component Hcp
MRKFLFSLFVLPVLFFTVNAEAQTQTFLKATATGFNFNGTSTTVGYENQNEISSFSNGVQSCAVSGKTCAPTFSGFYFTIQSNNAVTAFKSAQLQGKLITSVDLVMVKFSGEGPFEFYKIHMENVKVVNISEGASSEPPFISIGLQPAKIAWKTTVQNNIGGAGPSSSYGWDFAANVPFNYAF